MGLGASGWAWEKGGPQRGPWSGGGSLFVEELSGAPLPGKLPPAPLAGPPVRPSEGRPRPRPSGSSGSAKILFAAP